MLEVATRTINFYFHFTASKAGKTGIAGTTVFNVVRISDGSVVVDGTAVTEVNATKLPGIYKGSYATTAGVDSDFVAMAHTTDTTVDQYDVPSLQQVGKPWVENAANALKPTTAGHTLDVAVTGEAGVDWSNIRSPTTTQNLSGTTVKAVTDAVTAGTVSDKTGYSLSSAGIQAIWDRLVSALTTPGSIGAWILAALDVTVSSRAEPGDAMTLEDGSITADTIADGAITAAKVSIGAAEAIGNIVDGVDVTVIRRDSWAFTIAVGDLSGFDGLYVTVNDPESAENPIAQWFIDLVGSDPDGLLYIDREVATSSDGSITVNDVPTGNITVRAKSAVTGMESGVWDYDAKGLVSGGDDTTLRRAKFTIADNVTEEVSA